MARTAQTLIENAVNLCPLITVGVPVYNAMPYLQEAMDSLLTQECPKFEILAIVDGATDSSLEYLRSLEQNPSVFPRLRILTQPNRGVTRALNRMLRECRTPWLVRQDADDVSHPGRIARLLSAIETSPHAGMFYSFANYHPRGQARASFRSSRGTPGQLRKLVRDGYLLSICHPTVALNVQKTCQLGGYRIGLHNEDADLWWRMALAHEIQCVPEELVGFRQHELSVSARNLTTQTIAGLYVQYLLLSHLTHRTPQAIDRIYCSLEGILSLSRLRAKERLRKFNVCLAKQDYLRAVTALIASATSSPSYLLERLRDEFLPSQFIRNGISPELFFEREEALWL